MGRCADGMDTRSERRGVLLKEARDQVDAVLIEGSLRGDPGAFDELVRRYKDRIYGVLYRYTGNHEDAMDLAQEVFVRAFRGLQAFRGQAEVCTWLYSIAVNLARNRRRDQSRKGRNMGTSLDAISDASPGLPGDSVSPREAASKRELDEALELCLSELPETFRLAFCMKTFDGLRYEDIGVALGCPTGTVKSRLNEARKRLHHCLHARGVV